MPFPPKGTPLSRLSGKIKKHIRTYAHTKTRARTCEREKVKIYNKFVLFATLFSMPT